MWLVNFPSWLGKNSNAGKQKRLLKDVQLHMSAATTASDKSEVRVRLEESPRPL